MIKNLFVLFFSLILISCKKNNESGLSMVNDSLFLPNGWACYGNYDIVYNRTNAIAINNNNEIWIGGDFKLRKFLNSSFVDFPQVKSILNYNSDISVMTFDKNNILWIGTNWSHGVNGGNDDAAGIIKYDGLTFSQYSDTVATIHNRLIFSIAVDSSNNKWFGTKTSLTKFDGITWLNYDSINSPLKEYYPLVTINNTLWIGGKNSLTKFENGLWTVFNNSNSSFPLSGVRILEKDNSNNLWFIGYFSTVLWKFDGTTFTQYSIPIEEPQNPHFGNYPGDEEYYSIKADNQNNIWLGGYGKLIKFNGTVWSNYGAPVYVPGGDPRFPNVGDRLNTTLRGIVFDNDSAMWFASSILPLMKFKE